MKKITQINLFEGDGFRGFGKLGLENEQAYTSSLVFTNFISSALGLISIIAILWFIVVFISAAIKWMSSEGDKGKIETAKKKIMNGLVGLAITIFGIFIVKFVGTLIGIPNILSLSGLFSYLF